MIPPTSDAKLEFMKIFLSMSFSGSLLILTLLLGKRILKEKISRQWQYYIWLIVILRLLLPFGPETNLLGKTYQAFDQSITTAAPLPVQQPTLNIPENAPIPSVGLEQNNENTYPPKEDLTASNPLQDIWSMFTDHIWLIWLAVVLGLLLRKVTIYQGFIRYIHAGLTPVSDIEILDRFFVVAKQAGMKKPIELCVNPLISSPLLIGFFHPYIVLPRVDIPEKDFLHIVLHELTHYKRRDMFYKWLVQITLCLHWFNPLVYLMSREITKACEFSCDEAVLAKIGCTNAQEYGKTLLDAMAAVGKYKENLGSVTLSENKQLLKERLGAIMNFKKKSTAVHLLTGVLTLWMVFGATFIGVYPISAASKQPSSNPTVSGNENTTPMETDTHSNKYSLIVERSYEAGSLPLFQMAFPHLDEETQNKWLNRIYEDDNIAFFGAAINLFDEDCTQILDLAETVYKDNSIAFFSNLAMHMSDKKLEEWLYRALDDEKWAFQSVLFNALDLDDEFDKLKEKREKEQEEAQKAEYGAAGVKIEGKNYYYQDQLVNVFLDIRPNKAFYTLDMNPKGTVNIKIIRDMDNKITGVAYMTEEEIIELFGRKEDDPDDVDVETIPIDLKTVAAGESIYLGEFTLYNGDKIEYDILAETGNRMKVFFVKGKQKNVVYWSVNNLRQPGEALKCTADFTVKPPAKPGTYRLYLQAPDDTLRNVKGSISITAADN